MFVVNVCTLHNNELLSSPALFLYDITTDKEMSEYIIYYIMEY